MKREPNMQIAAQWCDNECLFSHLDGLSSLVCSRPELIYEIIVSYRQAIGVLGRGISPLQGRYIYRTTKTQNKVRHRCVEWDLH
jgi:hypothetical protein